MNETIKQPISFRIFLLPGEYGSYSYMIHEVNTPGYSVPVFGPFEILEDAQDMLVRLNRTFVGVGDEQGERE